jgi:predicted ABC-type ATPase
MRTEMPSLPEFVILVGPNGVGKSHVGAVLSAHFLCEYISIERFFKDRYSTKDAFRADQPAAYRALLKQLLATSERTGCPVVFEQVALSEHERTLIAALQRDRRTVLAEIWAEEHTSFRRVEDRGTAANFPKTPESLRRVRALYQREVRPRYVFALSLLNDSDLSDDAICRPFEAVLGPRRLPP